MVRGKDAVRLPAEESVQLPKLMVKGTPVCSFGIGVICTRDPVTRKIRRVFISEVLAGFLADENGLKEGDEILMINGQKSPALKVTSNLAHGCSTSWRIVPRGKHRVGGCSSHV